MTVESGAFGGWLRLRQREIQGTLEVDRGDDRCSYGFLRGRFRGDGLATPRSALRALSQGPRRARPLETHPIDHIAGSTARQSSMCDGYESNEAVG